MRKKIFKKIILGILVFFLILPFFIRPALAYPGTELSSYQFQFEEALESPEMNLQSFVNETVKGVMGSIIHFVTGRLTCANPIVGKERECIDEILGAKRSLTSAGLFPIASMFFTQAFTSPPASGIYYFADLGSKLGITKTAYAEQRVVSPTVSWVTLSATLEIWKQFRNISYLLFAIILVVMGFAIMFRVKISPQAVITIQSALPKIVIALVLITFSYAIVGFMLDLVILFNALISSIFENLFTKLFGGLGPYMQYFIDQAEKLVPKNSLPFLQPLFTVQVYVLIANYMLMFFTYAPLTLGLLIMPFNLLLGQALMAGGFVNLILGLFIGILLLIAYIRAIWTLLKAFAMIIINLIFAPFRILLGVFPGSNAIGAWFKDLLANMAVLPAMLILFFTGSYLMVAGFRGAFSAFATSNLGNSLLFGLIWVASALFFPIVGVVILLLIPKVADMIQSFMTKKPFVFGTAMGETVGAPARAFGYVGQVAKVGTQIGQAWTSRFGTKTSPTGTDKDVEPKV